MSTVESARYEQTTTVTQHSTTTSPGVIDKRYVKSIPGVLKLVEMLFGLVAFLVVVTSLVSCRGLSGLNAFYDFVVMLCVITTAILYFILVFKLQFRIFRCDCIFWPRVELGYYIGAIAVLLLANVLMSAVACTDQLKAGVAFGWFALIAYVVDLIFAIRAYRKATVSRRETTAYHESTTTTTTTARY